ncbi:type VII secretion-associated serine protease mycosin [Micromonospora sp. WMMD1120]|uniref:type VII secretion-associated serine protease mycosin n=1 Tax=Micromonospora sp. WMMD1120 TaxID=3016106 RepID=UPI002415BCAD|nr:type VII secretion-associated serine protease mycosin [Micromonospora sp. WMMD1120]MDG4809483.1 type VII secretion-associated serine protease mycosin [Micromonospora sp. WMMD1120]
MGSRRLFSAATAGLSAVLLGTGPAWAAPVAPPLRTGQCLPAPTGSNPDIPWPQRHLTPERAWTLTEGAGVVVAVLDSGVDARSPQLSRRVLPGVDLTTAGGGRADSDCLGHGTFVAGLIAAAPATGTGFVGVAPKVRILPIRITDRPDGAPEAIARGIRTAVDRGADVINVSAGTTVRSAAMEAAVRYAEQRDVVVVAAVGNRAEGSGVRTYPAALPGVVAVGAMNTGGRRSDAAAQSAPVALVAPGEDVVSIGPRGPGHWQGSGTSYATPFVAGTAALVRAYRPGLSAAQVRHRLQATADLPAAELPDALFGWGVVNPMAAVATVLPEEGRAGTVPGAARRAAAPDLADTVEVGPFLAAGVTLVLLAAAGGAVLAVLGPAGHRRRWRPARTVSPYDADPAPPAPEPTPPAR